MPQDSQQHEQAFVCWAPELLSPGGQARVVARGPGRLAVALGYGNGKLRAAGRGAS